MQNFRKSWGYGDEMLRHCVLLSTSGDAPEGTAAAFAAELRELPAKIPEIQSYTVALDAGIDADRPDANAALAVIAEFATAADYHTYSAHPDHVAVVSKYKPHLSGRSAIQMEA